MVDCRKVAFMVSVLAVSGMLSAATYKFKTDLSISDIDWSMPEYYQNNPSRGPAEGDEVEIPANIEVRVVAGSGNWTLLNKLSVVKPRAGAVLYVDVPSTYEGTAELSVPVSGFSFGETDRFGKLVKTGGGTLEFTAYNKVTYKSRMYDYYVNIDVMEGCLKLYGKGQTAGEYFYHGIVDVAEGAMLKICYVGYTCVAALFGDGSVSLEDTAVEQRLNLNSTVQSRFTGQIAGNIRIDISAGRHDIMCKTNILNSICFSANTVCGFTKLGMQSDLMSSLGKGNFNFSNSGPSGAIYLGSENETTDKTFWLGIDAFLDGGVHGGLTFDGAKGKIACAGNAVMRILTLCGSNAENPCVIRIPFPAHVKDETESVVYIKKKGVGTWSFEGDADRSSIGVVDVQEGTLRFDSIAEKGVACSLGYSTNLFEASANGLKADATPVDYAFALGGDATEGTMEYVGTAIGRCATRPIAVRSRGAFVSDVSRYWLENVHAFGTGEGTLVLSGASDHGNAATRLSDGEGILNVEKLGNGVWTLWGTNTFTGSVVSKGGRMVVWNPEKRYTWFRFTVKENGYGAPAEVCDTENSVGKDNDGNSREIEKSEMGYVQIAELAVYDSAGNNLVCGLKMDDENHKFTPENGYAGLEPGYVAYGRTSACSFQGSRDKGNFRGLDSLFDGTVNQCSGSFGCAHTTGVVLDKERTWVPYVFRLPDGEKRVATSMDVLSGLSGTGDYRGRNPISFRFEGSVDGRDWDILFDDKERPGVPDKQNRWYSNHEKGISDDNKGYEFSYSSSDVIRHSYSFTSVGAANGGVLEVVGDPIEVSGLVVDASASAGTISNFKFAESGTVDVRNAEFVDGEPLELPGDYSHLEGVGNLAKWGLVLDGEYVASKVLGVKNGKLTVYNRGLRVIFR